ncbi:MAG: putative DNA binding domain-containing protein [Synergistes sp.]|nr:putative DNA binding domain-containing protein [Synergistes sp.]
MNFETESIEFKSQFTEEIYKEVIAFVNTDGGVVYVGTDNDGNAVGLSDIDKECTRITNGIRDAIMPDVTMFVHFNVQEDKVVRITISEGTNKPYYLKKKGLKPSGVFVRQGTSSVPASPEQIRRMIKESDGDTFEDNRSLEQTLTFNEAKEAFILYGVQFSPEKYRALGITQKENDIYTNLALLLSDQCPHTTKVAVFSDEARTVFRDSREFGGSVFKQFKETINYLALCNKMSSVIKGIVRTDRQDYPDEAIREAFLNAIVHRDYSFSGSIIINVTDHKMEFISLGGLIHGLSPDDIRSGISQTRNKNLAEVFHRLRLIESYGTGIRRIFNLYAACPKQPQIEVTSNTFKIVLPNMNTLSAKEPKAIPAVTAQMQKILNCISENGRITEKEISLLFGLKKTRVFTIAKQMRDLGLIEVNGRGESKYYTRK